MAERERTRAKDEASEEPVIVEEAAVVAVPDQEDNISVDEDDTPIDIDAGDAGIGARERMMRNARNKYAFGDDVSDDEVAERMMADYDAEHDYAKKSREDVARMNEMAMREPELAGFIAGIYDGKPIEEVITYLSPLAQAMLNGDIDAPTYRRQLEEQRATKEKEDAMVAEFEAATVDLAQEYGISTEDLKAMITPFLQMLTEPGSAKKVIAAIKKANDYDNDIQAAEVRGRNAKISAERKSLARNDGMPRPNSAPSQIQEPRPMSTLDRIGQRREEMRRRL